MQKAYYLYTHLLISIHHAYIRGGGGPFDIPQKSTAVYFKAGYLQKLPSITTVNVLLNMVLIDDMSPRPLQLLESI